MALAAFLPAASPFKFLYQRVVLPLRLLRPRIVEDDPAPHRFAQGVGATFLLASSLVLFLLTNTVMNKYKIFLILSSYLFHSFTL
jgi:hypothetical protein